MSYCSVMFVWQFVLLAMLLTNQPLQACEDGWFRYRAKCFKYISSKVNFETGLNLCNQMNATMASVHSFDELTFVEDIARHYSGAQGVHWLWLGALRHSNGSFRWTDESEFSFTRWRHNCPDERRGEDCVLMSVFQTKPSHWCNYKCSSNYDHVICQRDFVEPISVMIHNETMNADQSNTTLVVSTSTDSESSDFDDFGGGVDNQTVHSFECNIGWTFYGQNCYKFVEQNESWHSALHLCQTLHNASLASVASEAEQIFLQTFLFSINEANEAIWLGGIRANPTFSGRVSSEKNLQNLSSNTNESSPVFIWIDQQPFNYENYAPHEPDNRGENENCLAMNNLEDYLGQWLDAPCSVQFGVACKRSAERVRFSSVWSEDNIHHQMPDLNHLMDRLRQEWQLVERLVSIEGKIERLTEHVSQRIKHSGNDEVAANAHERPMVGHLSSLNWNEMAQMNRWVKCSLLLGSLSCIALLLLVSIIGYNWLRNRWLRMTGANGCRQRSYQSVFSFRNLNYEEKALSQNDYEELSYAQAASSANSARSQIALTEQDRP